MHKWILIDAKVQLNSKFENELVEIFRNKKTGKLKTVISPWRRPNEKK